MKTVCVALKFLRKPIMSHHSILCLLRKKLLYAVIMRKFPIIIKVKILCVHCIVQWGKICNFLKISEQYSKKKFKPHDAFTKQCLLFSKVNDAKTWLLFSFELTVKRIMLTYVRKKSKLCNRVWLLNSTYFLATSTPFLSIFFSCWWIMDCIRLIISFRISFFD